jgi:hypothetical protein
MNRSVLDPLMMARAVPQHAPTAETKERDQGEEEKGDQGEWRHGHSQGERHGDGGKVGLE